MNEVMLTLVGAVILYPTGRFAVAGVTRGRLALRSRLDVLTKGADALLALAIAHTFVPWTMIAPVVWLLPVGLVGVAVGAVAARWDSLPLLRPARPPKLQVVLAAFHTVVSLILALVVAFL